MLKIYYSGFLSQSVIRQLNLAAFNLNSLIWIYLLVLFCFTKYIYANPESQNVQRNDVKGHVVDEASDEALPYANILIKGTTQGTTSNSDGYFVIVNAPASLCTLMVRYIGYATKEVAVDNRTKIPELLNIKLEQIVIESEGVTVYAEEYQMWKGAEEVSQVTFSPSRISSLPSLGEADIFRSLQLLPGISGVSDGSAGLYVRGGTPDQNLVMLDGMTVYHVDHFFGFFSAFNADAVKDVQVYKGGFPAKYGGRLSSVVDLTGKTGNSNKMRVGFGANLLSANAVTEIPIFGNGSWLLSFRRSYSDIIESSLYNKFYDFMSDNDESSTQNVPAFGRGGRGGRGFQQEASRPDFYFYDINSKISILPTQKDIFALSFYNGKDNLNESQELGGLNFLNNSNNTQASGTRVSDETTKWGNLGLSLKWSHQWHDRFNSNILVAGSNYFSEKIIDRSFNSENTVSEDTSQVFRGARAFASEEENQIKDLTFRMDNEWHLSGAHRLGFGAWISEIGTNYLATLNDTLEIINRNTQARQTTLYLQDKIKIFDSWNFTLGLRGTYFNNTESFYFEPRVSFHYAISNRLKFKGAWGQYNQFINRITNEDVLEGSRDFWLVADENLEPSSAEHKILGLSYETKKYLFEVEAYHKKMDNLIEFSRRFQRNADYNSLFFFGDGISKGIEFLVQKKVGALSGWLSYTLGDVTYTFPKLNNGEPFPASHDRTHELKFVSTLTKGKWNFSATWIFASGHPYTAPEAQYFIELLDGESQSYIHVGEKNTNVLPDYHRMDVSVSRRITESKTWDFEVGFSIFNLYNHQNVWYRKYDLEVTPIVVTDVVMLGITPTLYFKANF